MYLFSMEMQINSKNFDLNFNWNNVSEEIGNEVANNSI